LWNEYKQAYRFYEYYRDLPMKRIAARVGMPDPQHFNKQFRLLTGLSPSAARLGVQR
jgi:AraC-like DNA-binding protein